jgi:hypothetical protein
LLRPTQFLLDSQQMSLLLYPHHPSTEGCIMSTALSIRLPRRYHEKHHVWFESLETRRLFSTPANLAPVVMLDDANHPVATVEVIDGVLTVTTSDGVDDAMIGSSKSHPDQLFVHNNGARSYFSREGITGISVNLGDGDDAFAFYDENGLVNLPTTINGGAGDDEIGGEGDRDVMDVLIDIGDGPFAPVHLIGGEGDDLLGGGIGDTVAEGGPGNDTMRPWKGSFTVLDPAPSDTPTPLVSDDAKAAPIIDAPDDALVPDAVVVDLQANELSSGTAAAPEPLTFASPATPQNSLLTSEDSLLSHQADEIW